MSACGRTSPEWIGRTTMPDLFADDSIQFPRLLAEIYAVGLTAEQVKDLEASTGLHPREIKALFERAEIKFEAIKKRMVM